MDAVFELRFAAKQLVLESKRSERAKRKEKVKLKEAIARDDQERARIYAENAIRHRDLALQHLRQAAHIEAVAARVQTAVRTRQLTRTMGGIVRAMRRSTRDLDLQEAVQVAEAFETALEDMDVRGAVVEGALAPSAHAAAPEQEVQDLIARVADEHGLALNEELSAIASGSSVPAPAEVEATPTPDALTQRLDRLKVASS
jgi:charged multivesicular body protein 1